MHKLDCDEDGDDDNVNNVHPSFSLSMCYVVCTIFKSNASNLFKLLSAFLNFRGIKSEKMTSGTKKSLL